MIFENYTDFDLMPLCVLIFCISSPTLFSIKAFLRCNSNTDYNVSVKSKRYHSFPRQPRGKFSKCVKSQPPGQIFSSNDRPRASLVPFILINFALFHHFQKISIIKLLIYKFVRRTLFINEKYVPLAEFWFRGGGGGGDGNTWTLSFFFQLNLYVDEKLQLKGD